MNKILGTSKIRERGVLTIPKEVRDYLGLKQGDKITLIVDKGEVVIKRHKDSYENFTIKE